MKNVKLTEPIRDFLLDENEKAPRERGEQERERKPFLVLREPPLKPGFDTVLAVRLIVAALIFSAVLVFHPADIWSVFLLVLSALIAGYDLMIGAVFSVIRQRQYDERLVVFLVSLLAFIFLAGYEGAAVMLLYQFGTLLKRSAMGSIRSAVAGGLAQQPQEANVLRGGNEYTVGVHDISVGETVVVDPGETVAFDGIVIKGESAVDMSGLTGEDAPVQVEAGDALLAGSRNLGSVLYIEVRARAGESSAEKYLQLIRPEKAGKGITEGILARACSIYTPALVFLAVLYAVLGPLLAHVPFSESMHRALILLLMAGSSSFLLSMPVLHHTAIGSAAKRGILFKNSAALDRAAAVDHIVFDQTGTLTHGRLRVSSVKAAKSDPETLLKIAAHACAYSEQPLARAIVDSFKGTIYIELIGRFEDHGEEGVCVAVDDVEIVVGSAQMLRSKGVFVPDFDMSAEIAWFISIAGVYAGRIIFADDIKTETPKTIQDLSAAGYSLELITETEGSENETNFRKLNLTEITYAAGSEEKTAKLEMLSSEERRGRQILYVESSDKALTSACREVLCTVMNCLGHDIFKNDADILILSEKPNKIAEMLKNSKIVNKLTAENITITAIIKLVMILLAVLGKNLLWIAVLVTAIADLITILQAKRIR